MEKYFDKASRSKQKETTQQKHKRKYKEEYVQYGFIASGPEDNQQPLCIICNKALSNESLVPSKLSRHLEKNHPTFQNKPKGYFANLKSQTNKQAKIMNSYLKLPEKRLIASYKLAHLLAKRKKAHTDAESVIGPALAIVVEEMLGTAAAEKVRGVPLSDNTISRRIEELSSDLKDQVREHSVATDNKLSVLWSLQVDESTDRTGKSHLLAFIRCINNETLENECLFCKELKSTTNGEDIFKLVDENILLSEL
ncbi:zinc finger BED domain-containing protein 5-like [Clavelina lepadiformis]|uniref:zinc finger BED domain-containing protein 5-like n=1 Tax=Clavelina lepadiformis TaxID=159417 RepID=UPI0040437F72